MTEGQTDVRMWVTAVILMGEDTRDPDACIRSLLRGTYVPGILIVDDSAGRLPEETYKKRYPGITIFRTGLKTGKWHAANCGLHLVRTPYALFLSPDVQAGRSMTERLLDAMLAEERCYAAQARIVRAGEPGRTESTGVLLSAAGQVGRRNRGRTAKGFRPGTVFAPDVRAAMFSMNAIEDIGLFDERLTGIAAEADLGCRAQRIDGKCLFVPGARAGISEEGSLRDSADDPHAAAESLYVLDKNLPAPLLALGAPARAAGTRLLRKRYAQGGDDTIWQKAIERSRSLSAVRIREDLLREAGVSVTKQPLPEESLTRPEDPACGKVYPLYVGTGMRTESGDLPSVARLAWHLVRNIPGAARRTEN